MTKTMSSSSPTQPPPTQTPENKPAVIPENKPAIIPENKPASTAERKPLRTTPVKRRLGETPTARTIKGILRPPIKVLYYVSTWTKKHKLSSLAIILLLVASIAATTYAVTDQLPFGINHDPFVFPYNGGKGEGNLVKSWLYACKMETPLILYCLTKISHRDRHPTQHS